MSSRPQEGEKNDHDVWQNDHRPVQGSPRCKDVLEHCRHHSVETLWLREGWRAAFWDFEKEELASMVSWIVPPQRGRASMPREPKPQ